MKNIEDIIHRLNTHEWKPEKERSAILLIDLQEYFREIIAPILPNILKVLNLVRERKIPVFFTQHSHKHGESSGMLGEWWADSIIQGTAESQLLPELGLKGKDTVIAKNRYSAFYNTQLEERLNEADIKDLIIGGVMTNLCCETTARDAFVRDFRIFFLADGTATVNDDFQMASLVNLSYGFATLLTCSQLEDWL